MVTSLPGRAALSGLKVIEEAGSIAGPYCAKLLGDLGAQVIKVEPPQGDPARCFGPFPSDEPNPEKSGLFLYLNTSKRGLTLNLEKATGREIFFQLLEGADVLVTDRQPAEARRLGLELTQVKAANPALVVTSITPFGLSGPYQDFKAYEINLWHIGGLGFITRDQRPGELPGPPVVAGGHQALFAAGLAAAVATMTAVYQRLFTGQGQLVEVATMEVLASMLMAPVAFAQMEGRIVGIEKHAYHPSGLLFCQDGQVLLDTQEERHWAALIEGMMGNPGWAEGGWWRDRQSRIDNADFLLSQLSGWLADKKRDWVIKEGQARHVPFAALYTAADVAADEQLAARNFFADLWNLEAGRLRIPSVAYQFTATPWRVSRPPPRLGEHSNEILGDLGFTRRNQVKLRQTRII